MNGWLIALFLWFGLLAAIQLFLVFRFVRACVAPSVADPKIWPPVLAVLCLRGADTFLPECLRRLVGMDYPNFILRIVIDSETDPARDLVEEFLRDESPMNVEVTYLEHRLAHCSGKVSGLLLATQQMPDGCQVVAFFDGDTLVHPTCLKELVAPLQNPSIGITSGNRWYAPPVRNLAMLVRFTWNAFAVPIMNVAQLPWGGCMALRAREMSSPAVRRYCEQRFNEDATLASHVTQKGQRVRFVAGATVVNQENVLFKNLYNFLVRQWYVQRSCNVHWRLVFCHILAVNLSTLVLYSLLFPIPYWTTVAGLVVVIAAQFCLQILGSDLMIRRLVARRGERLPAWPAVALLLGLPVAMICIQVLNLMAVFRVLVGGLHTWRGITYRFNYRGGTQPFCQVIAVEPLPPEVPPITTVCTADECHGEGARLSTRHGASCRGVPPINAPPAS